MRQPLEYIFPAPPDPAALDQERIPRHVAVIMDGNGRWAKKRAMNRINGHKAGIGAVRELIRCANDVGVDYLTIYSFSTENWKRPQDEVNGLMNLFAKTMLAELDGLHEEGVRVRTIGNLDALPEKTARAFEDAWEKTKNNAGMTLVIAVNYGARDEILEAVQQLVDEAVDQAGQGSQLAQGSQAGQAQAPRITEEAFAAHLHTADIPDPDLLIRTSGEMRVSNFLLWQIAYTEFYCSDVLWPDFDRYELLRALLDFQQRDRRFGAV